MYRKDESSDWSLLSDSDFPNLTCATCVTQCEVHSTQLCDAEFVTCLLTIKSYRFMSVCLHDRGTKSELGLL